MKIEDAVARWVAAAPLNWRTLEQYVYALRLVVRSGLETVESLTRDNVRKLLAERADGGTSPQTCNRMLAAMQSLVKWLESRGEIAAEARWALDGLRLDTRELPPPRFLSPEEYGRLLAAGRAFRPLLGWAIALAVNTGVRLGELRQLHHEDLELSVDEPFVRVRRTQGRETKTRRERGSPISRAFADELREAGFGPPRKGPIFVANVARLDGARKGYPSGSLYLRESTLNRWMAIVRVAAGLGSDVNWITTRHTFCSWLWMKGVSPGLAAKWAGHSVAVAEKHYAGLAPAGHATIAEGFAEVAQAHADAREAVSVAKESGVNPTLAADVAALVADLKALRPVLEKLKGQPETVVAPAASASPARRTLPERARALFRRPAKAARARVRP